MTSIYRGCEKTFGFFTAPLCVFVRPTAYSSCGFHATHVGLHQTPRLETGLASTPGMNPWLILIVDKSLVCQRGLPGRLSTHRPALNACAAFRGCAPPSPSAGLCSAPADFAFAPCPRGSSRFAAFGCALRFAPCARHFSPSGLRRTATGTGMHFYPQFAIVDPHRTQSVLVALVAHWAYFGLFPPQAAASVRILNSQWSSCCA